MKTPVSRKAPRGQYLQWTLSGSKMPRSTKCNRKKAESRSSASCSSSKSRSTPLPRKNRSVIRRHPISELATRQLEPVTPQQLSLPGEASLSASPPLISIPSPTQTSQDDEMPSPGNPDNCIPLQQEHFPLRERELSPDQSFSLDREFPLDALEVQLHEDDGFYLVDDEVGIPDDTCSEDSFILRLDESGEEERLAEVIASDAPDPAADDSLEETTTDGAGLFLSVNHRIRILLLLATMKRHNLTYPAAEDIMTLTGILSDQETLSLPKYLLKRTIEEYSCSLIEHHMCSCGKYIGVVNFTTFECLNCEKIVNTSQNKNEGNIFLYMSLKEQLEGLLKHHALDILKPQERRKIQEYNYEDIYDGKEYRKNVMPGTLSINFFVDGLQVASTSKKSAWPVLVCLNELPLALRRKHILLVSLWLSLKKPNCQEYLKPFVEECVRLEATGISFENKGVMFQYRVKVLMGIADTIARPLLRNSTQFNGRYGCGLCLHPGFRMKYQKGHIRSYSIVEREYPLRTHDQVMQWARAAQNSRDPVMGIVGVSVLSQIKDFNVARGLDLDLFHALVNVAKRFAHLWFLEKFSKKPFSISSKFSEVNARLLQITPTSDVSRNPRSLKYRSDYRGHEWFHWVVDYSIPVLKGILPARFLNHWSFLVHGIVLIMQNSVAKSEVIYATRYLAHFVKNIDHLYGKHHVTFSAHLLTHLGASVTDYGQPWAHSAFIFESFNAEIKQAVKSSNGAALQICKAMQRKIALKKLEEDVRESMTERHLEYFESVSCRQRLAPPHLTIGDAALLGAPKSGSVPLETFNALRRAGVQCNESSTFLSYDRCQLHNEVYHSSNYSRVSKQNNSVVLLTSDEVFVIQSFVVFKENCFVVGNIRERNRPQKLCDVPVPHIIVLKERPESIRRCFPITVIDSKLLFSDIKSATGESLTFACVNVLKMEMLR